MTYIAQSTNNIKRRAVAFFTAAALFGYSCAPLAAQQETNHPPISELAEQNLDRVAASAVQIKAILVQDPGIMVELKRWVAKDATDHGQIVSDQDLTDQAIIDRLDRDVAFRSEATRLVQQFGFLLPELNPDSQMGKQQALLLQQRATFFAEQEQQALAQERQQSAQSAQDVAACTRQRTPQPLCSANNPETLTGSTHAPMSQRDISSAAPQQNPPDAASAPGPNGSQRANTTQTSIQRTQFVEPSDRPGSDLAPFGTISDSSTSQAQSQSLSGNAGNTESIFSQSLAGNISPDLASNDPLTALGAEPFSSAAANSLSPNAAPDQPYSTSSFATGSNTQRNPEFAWLAEPRPAPTPMLVRTSNPYADIPSLYDMYLQAVPRPAAPERFGSEIFENGLRDMQSIPMDLPVGPDYVVGPGDGLAVNLWGGVSQRLYSTVDREGRLNLPELAPALVSGKSLSEVQQDLQESVRTQFRDESVDVSLSRLRTIRIYEVGDVARPGAYDISSLSTPLNALFAAGGPTAQGSMRIVKHYRGAQLVEQVDLYDLLLHGVKSGMARLENGDTVLVPPLGPQVTVEGMIRRPAIYELKDEKSLASVFELAGGMLPAATLRHIEVQRLVAHDKQTMLSLDIPETDGDAAVTQKLDSFQVQDGDRIRIYPIAPYNQDAVYLEGHVLRPGRYSYRDNMRVGDLIASYKDLLPEPSTQYAEIIRLNAPDFHPTVESFDLGAAMDSPSASPLLHPMDTVRIFSRYDFENPPTVSVWGDVRTPGTFQTSGQIRLADAVHLAGGLSPDAQTQDAQVFRYLPDGQFKIFSVSLSQALAGDPTQNIQLQSRDRLLIHKNPDALQPQTVYIEGEVGRPGRYPLTTNMTVADLIKVGGGLQPSADTQTAELTRYAFASAPSDQSKLTAQHQNIPIAAALAEDQSANLALHNGDVLTVRQLAGWDDLGSSITVKGEVVHPGTYGIRSGEKLSSIIARAGGFAPGAYPYGAVLERVEVRELEAKQQDQLVIRLHNEGAGLQALPDGSDQQKQAKALTLQQYQTVLTELSANNPVGRVNIRISSRLKDWQNSASDIDVRAGDTLVLPKRPGFVMVSGQVFNPTAVSFRPGKSARWYLTQSGGPTTLANKRDIFVVRADGSVVGQQGVLLRNDVLGATLEAGDVIVVPERAMGGGPQWQNLFTSAQLASSFITTVFIALHY